MAELTGIPSIDKPWQKYYLTDEHDIVVPRCNLFRCLKDNNVNNLSACAISYFGSKITYQNLIAYTSRVKESLLKAGISKGDVVSILSLNTPETVYVFYALNDIGAVSNFIPANISTEEITRLIKSTNSKMLFALDRLLSSFEGFACDVPVVILPLAGSVKGIQNLIMSLGNHKLPFQNFKSFVSAKVDNNGEILCEENLDDQLPAVILYTSGTTGEPKGVVLSSYALNSEYIQCKYSNKGYRQGETFLNILPPFFGFGIGMLHLCFCAGLTEISMVVPKVKPIIKMIKKYKPNRFIIGPAFTDVIEQYDGDDLSFLCDLTAGGGSIPEEKEQQINNLLATKKSGSKMLVGYGMTELASGVTMNQNNAYKEQSIGIPLPLTNVKILDLQTSCELGYEEEGELLVSAESLMLCYFNDEETTNSTIVMDENGKRWIRTGDLAKIDVDGFLYITGRLKRIYITQDIDGLAYKLFPQRIEDLVSSIEEIDKCAVVVVEDKERENVPVVFATIANDVVNSELEENILKLLSEKLPAYYRPLKIVIIDEMPVNTSQKIDYRVLGEMCS